VHPLLLNTNISPALTSERIWEYVPLKNGGFIEAIPARYGIGCPNSGDILRDTLIVISKR